MNPTFGSRLWNAVFEQNDEFIAKKVESIIREDVTQWIPGITVKSVDVKYLNDDQSVDLRDIYKLYIVVTFIIDNISATDSVELTLDVNKV
jgi:phage baseplate assembly protein W